MYLWERQNQGRTKRRKEVNEVKIHTMPYVEKTYSEEAKALGIQLDVPVITAVQFGYKHNTLNCMLAYCNKRKDK